MGEAASGSQTRFYYSLEKDGALEPVAPVFKPIRFNTATLNRDGTQIDSNENNPSRQRPPSRRGTYSVVGEMLSELTAGSFDDLMAAALQSEWSGGAVINASMLNFLSADNSINDPFGRFVSSGFIDTDTISIQGASDPANNGTGLTATTVTANKIIVSGATFVDEDLGQPVIVATSGDELIVGSYVPTFTIIEVHNDIGVQNAYSGCRVNEIGLAAPLNEAAKLTFGYIGEKVEEFIAPGDAVFQDATGTPMMVTTSGYLEEAGAVIDYATDYTATMSNNMEALYALFSRSAYSVSNGVFTVEGSMSAYMPDDALINNFINEVEVDHVIQLQDNEAPVNFIRFTFPTVNYTQLDKPVDGQGAIIQNYTLSAGYDETAGTTVKIERGTV